MITMTAREFNQAVARAQRVADDEPVLVTRHGEPAYVLLSVAEFERLRSAAQADTRSLLERLAPPPELDPDAMEFERVVDLGRPPLDL